MKQRESSLRTKTALAAALKDKMSKKEFSKITVSELIEACDINRKTFYYHFEDIYALLKWTFEQETVEVFKNFDLLVNIEEAINFVLDYIDKNQYFINCALDSVGYSVLKNFLHKDFLCIFENTIESGAQQLGISIDDNFKHFLAEFYTEAFAGIIISDIKKIDHYDRDEVVQNIILICKSSIPQILIAHSSGKFMK